MRDLFEFNKRCNDTIIHTMLEAGFAHKRVIEEISHILNTHYMWIAKVNGEPFHKNLWQPILSDDLFRANTLIHKKTDELLSSDSSRVVSIEVDGKIVERKVESVLYEIILFSNKHRAKVEMLFKKFNIELPTSSFLTKKKLDLMEEF